MFNFNGYLSVGIIKSMVKHTEPMTGLNYQ